MQRPLQGFITEDPFPLSHSCLFQHFSRVRRRFYPKQNLGLENFRAPSEVRTAPDPQTEDEHFKYDVLIVSSIRHL
jgi:hypothetical protein